MTPDDCIEEIAPQIVVRAALFPLCKVLGLRDKDLAALAADVGTRSTQAFEQAYLESVETQRRALFEATIDDPRFSRALSLTNDALSRHLTTRHLRSAPRDKRARRLDATLYRYLARAVWRTQPCDLWAGVTVADWGTPHESGQSPRATRSPRTCGRTSSSCSHWRTPNSIWTGACTS